MSIEIIEQGALPLEQLPKPNRDIRIYVDSTRFISDARRQIYLQLEPEAIRPIRQYLLSEGKKYDVIYTFDCKVLEQCSNARKFTFYTQTWLNPEHYTNIDLSQKQFMISTVVGSKCLTEGHRIRQHLYFHQHMLDSLPFVMFRSCAQPVLPALAQNPFLESKDIAAKHVLFDTFQFHLTIENSRQENYFTEKLIDCLVTKTIPLYYGCPNIHEYFDTTGWIVLEHGTVDEILSKCAVLTPSYYSQYLEAVETNYTKAMEWKENLQRFSHALLSIPGYIE
jgi:hypothetical protein